MSFESATQGRYYRRGMPGCGPVPSPDGLVYAPRRQPDLATYAKLEALLPPEVRPCFDYIRDRPLCLVVILGAMGLSELNFWDRAKNVRELYAHHSIWFRRDGFLPTWDALALVFGRAASWKMGTPDLDALPQCGAVKVQVRSTAFKRKGEYWWKIPPDALERFHARQVVKRLRREGAHGTHT